LPASESTEVRYWNCSYVSLRNTVEYHTLRDSPAGDAAYSEVAVGDRPGRSGSLEGHARVARGARGHSPELASPSTFSTPCLGFSQFVYLLLWLDRTTWRRRFVCVEATPTIVTTTIGVLHFGLGGNWMPGFGTGRFLGGGLS